MARQVIAIISRYVTHLDTGVSFAARIISTAAFRFRRRSGVVSIVRELPSNADRAALILRVSFADARLLPRRRYRDFALSASAAIAIV